MYRINTPSYINKILHYYLIKHPAILCYPLLSLEILCYQTKIDSYIFTEETSECVAYLLPLMNLHLVDILLLQLIHQCCFPRELCLKINKT